MIRLRAVPTTRGMSPAEAAAHWAVARDARALSENEEAAFAVWHEVPAHAEAFRRAKGALGLFDTDLAGDDNLRALRQAALEAAPAVRPPRWALPAAIAASLAAMSIYVGVGRPGPPLAVPPRPAAVIAVSTGRGSPSRVAPLEYATGIGERRSIRLPDGSTLTLNTRTRLAVAFSDHRRLVHLYRGQALFEVAHDANRPFTVEAADRQVTALGTIFEVRVEPGRMNVTLLRGRVLVDRMPDAAEALGVSRIAPTILKPGQQFDAELGAAQKIATVDIDRQLLWRNGFVEFDNEPLGRAVVEMNRYSSRPIVLSGDGVAALRVSGVFRTGSPDQFIDAVQGILPVDAQPTAQGGIELSLSSK